MYLFIHTFNNPQTFNIARLRLWIDKTMIDLSYFTGRAAMPGHEKTVRASLEGENQKS